MNIYLIAYTKQNLGDDLFTSMLISKYPNVNFDINIEKTCYGDSFKKYSNVNIINKKRNLEEIEITKYDAIVYIGGSIFMEQKNGLYKLREINKFIKEAKKKNIPFFYINCNFGPYTTNEYLELARDTFSYCEDVCFRDKYSYDLFKDIKNVRYIPDLVLSYELNNLPKKENTVGISVIDLSIREELKELENEYIQTLKNNIEDYQRSGKIVYLFSFCEYEGDENTIKKIENYIIDKEKLKIVKYIGNIEEFLNIYSQMEYMICARFHSMIISANLKQKVMVLSYSDKITNVIKDLEFPYTIKNFNDKILALGDFKIAETNNLKNESEKQLSKLDEFLKSR